MRQRNVMTIGAMTLILLALADTAGAYYMPRIGRFLNRDPIGERGAMNLYLAMQNNPVNGIDPDGRACLAGLGCSGTSRPNEPSGPDLPPGTHPPPDGYPPPSRPPPPFQPGCKKPPGKCDDCWQTCLLKEIQDEAAKGGLGGFVVCRADGCRCACVNERPGNFPAVDPESEPGGHAVRMCAIEHEERHVDQGGCNCAPKPCLRRPKTEADRKDEECSAAAAEIECLCKAKGSCGGRTACLNRIDQSIQEMVDYCAGLGDDVYQLGAPRCP